EPEVAKDAHVHAMQRLADEVIALLDLPRRPVEQVVAGRAEVADVRAERGPEAHAGSVEVESTHLKAMRQLPAAAHCRAMPLTGPTLTRPQSGNARFVRSVNGLFTAVAGL